MINQEYKDKSLSIIKQLGYKNQTKKLSEEMFELLEQLIIDNDIEHIKEEISDVFVIIYQFIIYKNIDESDIKNIMMKKIDRTLSLYDIESKSKTNE